MGSERPRRPLHERLRTHARLRPDKAAYIWYGRAVTYAELDAASDAFAARLGEFGVKKGEPVALFMNNCPQYIMAHYGVQKIGAIVCPCSPLFKGHELEYQLADLGARVIVAAADLLPIVESVRGQTALEHVFAVHYQDLLPEVPSIEAPQSLLAWQRSARAAFPKAEDFLDAARSGAPCPPVELDMDDVALLTYTSGSTGLPKGAMLTYANASFKTAAAADHNGATGEDVMLAAAPLYHIAGMLMGLNVVIYSGATCVLLHRFEPRAALQAIERYRVSWWYSIATMNLAAMHTPGVEAMDLSSLRRNPATSFGIALTEALAEEWRAYAPNCTSYEAGYGLSETHTMDVYMPVDAIRWGAHGLPIPGNEIRILDPESGNPRLPGEQGEIVMRSPGVFKGYWGKPDATAVTLRDGWVHTGDMGVIDADGYLTFTGRFKEMIKVSGYSVFPEQVESILVKHPGVAQAAVIGVPDETKGEVIRAFIVRAAGQHPTAEEIIEWSRRNMASYKAPRDVRFVDELPATGAGKVLRRLLADRP